MRRDTGRERDRLHRERSQGEALLTIYSREEASRRAATRERAGGAGSEY